MSSSLLKYTVAVASGMLLAGCAPQIIVKPLSSVREKVPGVYYTLPKTRIETTFQVKKLIFVAGPFTPATPAEEKQFPFLASNKPDGDSWAATVSCPKDGAAVMRFEIESATVSTRGVPDAEHVYMVQLPAQYFRDQDITLKLTPDGVATSASLSVTDNRVDLAMKLAGDVFGMVVPSIHPKSIKAPPGKTPREIAYAELGQIAIARSQLIHQGSTNGSVAERLKALADREAELAVLWTGKLVEKIGEAKLTSDPTAAAANTIGYLDACAGVSKTQGTHSIAIKESFVADAASDSVLKKITGSDKLSEDIRNEPSTPHGLVYRMPRATEYKVSVDSFSGGKPRDLVTSRVLVAQFGNLLYLPTRVGGKSTTTGIDFNESGGIMVLTAKGAGADASPLQTALSDNLKRDDELADLERKQKILELKQKIRDLENPAPAATSTP